MKGDDYLHASAWGRLLPPLFALALLPVTRSSPWHALLGGSFERAVALHRLFGAGAGAAALVHGAAMLIKHRPHNALGKADESGRRKDNAWDLNDPGTGKSWMFATKPFTDKLSGAVLGRGVVYGSAAALCLALFLLLSAPPLRRRSWRAFKAAHFCLGVPFFVLASLHYYVMLWYALPSLLLYAADKALSAHRARRAFAASAAPLRGGVLRLTVAGSPARHPHPGQFVYLHCAAASAFEWHPFSVVAAAAAPAAAAARADLEALLCDGDKADLAGGEGDEEAEALAAASGGAQTVFLIKGEAGNARSFAARLLAAPAGALRVRLDGPYGRLALHLERYAAVVLLAGGVGITPFVTVAERLCALQDAPGSALRAAFLRWTVRDATAAEEWLPGWLGRLQAAGPFQGRCELRCTAGVPGETPPPDKAGLVRFGGRLDVAAVVAEAVRAAAAAGRDARAVAVLACGPAGLLAAAQGAAAAAGAHFHHETFEL